MKKKKQALCLLLVFLALSSCAAPVPPDDTEKTSFKEETSMSQETQEISPVSPREITLFSGDAEITLQTAENKLFISELKTPDGEDLLSEESIFPLPSKNGETDISWEYRSSSLNESENGNTAEFNFTDTAQTLELQILCTATKNGGPFVFESKIKNTSEDIVRITPENFASVSVDCQKADVWRISKESGWAEGITRSDGGGKFNGKGIYVTPAEAGTSVRAWVNTEQNFNSSGSFPLVYLDREGKNGLLVALEWSSGRVTLETEDGLQANITVTLDNAGVARTKFTTNIPAGETLDLPPVYIMPYTGDVDSGSNVLKSWFFDNRAPKTLSEDPAEPLTQMDMQIGLDADTLDVDAIKWDYGWWSNEVFKDWRSLEGSWQLRNDAYVGVLSGYGVSTMREFSELAHQRGVSWTVYLLLHDTLGSDRLPTNEYGEFNSLDHPEWFSNRRIADDMGCSADLGNEECVEYLKTELTKFFSENGIDTWRSDFEPINYFSDKENRHDANGTDVMYWCSVGFADLVNHLSENVDGFRYESCSSGGSMKDLYTARLATVINCDDSAHYLSLRTSFYDSSYVIHPAQLQIPCNTDRFNADHEAFFPVVTVSDSSYDLSDAMLHMGYRSMVLGVPMFSSWTATLPREHIKQYAEMYDQKLRPLIREGELYHILPRPDGINWDGVMYSDLDSENEIKGAVFLFKPSETASDTYHVTLRGLDENTVYELVFEDRPEQNFSASGKTLMTDGFDVEIKLVGSEIIWITEAK